MPNPQNNVENDIDYEKNSLVRREINATGRSRAFINDTPVSLTQIKQFTERLVNINSQHNTLALRDKNFHLELLDVLSGMELQRIDFSQLYRVLQDKKKHLKNQIERLDQEEKDKDYYWCACGLSKNGAFCDGSHKTTNIMPMKFTVQEGKFYFLCGCKKTSKKPFCDGSHSKS